MMFAALFEGKVSCAPTGAIRTLTILFGPAASKRTTAFLPLSTTALLQMLSALVPLTESSSEE